MEQLKVLHSRSNKEWGRIVPPFFREDEITNKAIDIRALPNYKELSPTDILFHRKDTVALMIKEAVRKGYIQPL